MHTFDYSFLQSGLVPVKFLTLTAKISEIRALQADRLSRFPDIFPGLELQAKVASVRDSNAIEGVKTTEARLTVIVTQGAEPRNRNEAEIAGYRDALNLIHTQYRVLTFSEETILALHKILFSYTGYPGGSYKQDDNVIVQVNPQGQRSIRFKPISAAETPQAMQDLVLAYTQARDDATTNQLLLISNFILDFLCIHPFSDGNGRISRLLTLLLLYKSGFDAGKYVSMEQKIEQTKNSYYSSLKTSSEGWEVNQNDALPFAEYFITTLFLCYKDLDAFFVSFRDQKVNKTQRIETAVLNSLLPISKRELARLLPDVSVTTIETVLGKLVREDKITKIGQGPLTQYLRKSE